MFVFDNSEDLDIATYEYRIYQANQVEADPANAGYYRLIGNVSINAGTITPYRQGFNLANVFTISVENSTTTSTTSTTSAVSYYGAIRAIDTSGNAGPWTLIEKTSTDTPLIDEEFIGSLTAAKITTGTIGAAEITLNGANSIIKSSNYSAGLLGWKITGLGDAEFNDLTVRTALDIGGSDASSFHVDIDGNLWLGASTYATAPFKVSNSGNVDVGSTTVGDASSFHIDNAGNIWSGAGTFNTATNPFSVTAAGALTASSVTITGGTVGGVNASANTLFLGTGTYSNNNTPFFVGLHSGVNKFSLGTGLTWDGGTLSINGGGTFTGALSGGTIQIGSGESVFKADGNGIYLGSETFSSAEFRVTPAGAMTSISGTIGGWNIGSSYIRSSGSQVTLSSDGTLTVGSNVNDQAIISNTGDFYVKGYDGGTYGYGAGNTRFYGPWFNVKKGYDSTVSEANAQLTYKDLIFFNSTSVAGIYINGGNDGGNAYLNVNGIDGGFSLRSWTASSNYMSLATTNMSGSEYCVLSDGTNTFLSGGATGTTYIRAGNNDTNGQIVVSSGSVTVDSIIVSGLSGIRFPAASAVYNNMPSDYNFSLNFAYSNNSYMYVLVNSDNGAVRLWSTAAASDRRIKDNINENVSSHLNKFYSLKAYDFEYNDKKPFVGGTYTPTGEKEVGLIAQEVKTIFPNMVIGNEEDSYLQINYQEFCRVLIAASLDQNKRIEELSTKVEELESRLI